MDNPVKKYKFSAIIKGKNILKIGGQPLVFRWIKKWKFCGNVEKRERSTLARK